jgi:hypothetical protein
MLGGNNQACLGMNSVNLIISFIRIPQSQSQKKYESLPRPTIARNYLYALSSSKLKIAFACHTGKKFQHKIKLTGSC